MMLDAKTVNKLRRQFGLVCGEVFLENMDEEFDGFVNAICSISCVNQEYLFMTKEEAKLVQHVLDVAKNALESCREGYGHEGDYYQYFDETKVSDAIDLIERAKVYEK